MNGNVSAHQGLFCADDKTSTPAPTVGGDVTVPSGQEPRPARNLPCADSCWQRFPVRATGDPMIGRCPVPPRGHRAAMCRNWKWQRSPQRSSDAATEPCSMSRPGRDPRGPARAGRGDLEFCGYHHRHVDRRAGTDGPLSEIKLDPAWGEGHNDLGADGRWSRSNPNLGQESTRSLVSHFTMLPKIASPRQVTCSRKTKNLGLLIGCEKLYASHGPGLEPQSLITERGSIMSPTTILTRR